MSISESIERIRSCVVQIRDAAQGILGTGFFVSDEAHVVTARHVIAGRDGNDLRVGLASPNIDTPQIQARANFALTECDIIGEDVNNDLALLRLRQNPFRGELGINIQLGPHRIDWLYGVPSFYPSRPQDGAQIAVSGYPMASPTLLTNAGWVATAWASEQDVGRPAHFWDRYIADLRINPGNSGGPVYLEDSSEIIGVCVSHSLALVYTRDAAGQVVPAAFNNAPLLVNAGIAHIIPTKYVIALLDHHNVVHP